MAGDSNKGVSAKEFKKEFGKESSIYRSCILRINSLWEEAKKEKKVQSNFNSWKKDLALVYGYEPKPQLFRIHTYLATLLKLAVYLRVKGGAYEKNELESVVNGGWFRSNGIENLVQSGDPFKWILYLEIRGKASGILKKLTEKLSCFDFSQLDEDFFKEIYEEAIPRKERRKAGEYYTPEWIVEYILKKVLDIWKERGGVVPKILDPACGSGTFLFHSIQLLKEELRTKPSDEVLNVILTHVAGIDINPFATLTAKANYLIALGDLLQGDGAITIPVHTTDSLKRVEKAPIADIIVGNPPWITMSSIKKLEYQNFLKEESIKYNLIGSRDVHLFTQIDMATLFFCKCSDIYLKKGGIISFVMPRSVITGTIHHVNFREFRKPKLDLEEILDLEYVSPLFHMPACVLIAEKGRSADYPVPIQKFKGVLPHYNMRLKEVRDIVSSEKYSYSPPKFSSENSFYYDKFNTGISIFPRPLYFIDLDEIKKEDGLVSVRTSDEASSRRPWNIQMGGEVEQDFVYATLHALDIVPFGCTRMRPVIVPVIFHSSGYELLDVSELEERGYIGMTNWSKRAQKEWEERRTEKSGGRFPKLIDRLNYNNLLSKHDPNKRYAVLYNATGSNLYSCIVDKHSPCSFSIGKGMFEVEPKRYVFDVKTWFYETNNTKEAHYLCAVFNSDEINTLIKPLQPRGLGGPRAIHRRPFCFPIPKFNEESESHLELAEIGRNCCGEVQSEDLGNPRKERKRLSEMFEDEKKRIHDILREILKTSEEQLELSDF